MSIRMLKLPFDKKQQERQQKVSFVANHFETGALRYRTDSDALPFELRSALKIKEPIRQEEINTNLNAESAD